MSLLGLISTIEKMIIDNNPKIKNIKDPNELLVHLTTLSNMVGMKSVKVHVTKQIKYLIRKNNFDQHLLHSVIYGPPGTGKSNLGAVLCQIWSSVGCLKHPPANEAGLTDSHRGEIESISSTINVECHTLMEKIRTYQVDPGRSKAKMEMNHAFEEIHSWVDHLCKMNDLIHYELNNTTTVGDIKYIIASRDDFVAPYQGQSAGKTIAFLTEHLGKVIFIDEAYSLINGDRDEFGHEALTALNLFMSQHSAEIIIILGGYKELMKETIFRSQPGLQSRCTWTFDIEKYTYEELHKIFVSQVHREKWTIDDQPDGLEDSLESFFKRNYEKFPGFGRDTDRLFFFSKLEQTDEAFENDSLEEKKLYLRHIESAMKNLVVNQACKSEMTQEQKMLYV